LEPDGCVADNDVAVGQLSKRFRPTETEREKIKMITNADIFERAQDIAVRRRDGGSFVKYLDLARAELQQPTAELRKVVKSTAKEEMLRKKGALAAQARRMPGIGSVDPDRRLEIGEVETTEAGRVRAAITNDSLSVNSVNVLFSDIDKTLRTALVASSADFNAAETDVEQVEQRAIIGVVIDSILRRDRVLAARVKESKLRERFDN
jgi:hypothetical protein